MVNEDLAHPATVGKGGHVMFVMQWLHSLASTGHDVVFVETLPGPEAGEDRSSAVAWFRDAIERYWSLGDVVQQGLTSPIHDEREGIWIDGRGRGSILELGKPPH